MIPGVLLQELHEALLDAYNKASLRQMLRFRLNRNLDEIVGDGPLRNMMFDLLTLAEEEGWEGELVREAQRFNPGNAALNRIYEQVGWAPQIRLVDHGVEQPAATARASAGGLEKLIRAGNPVLDMAVWRTRLSEVEVRLCRVDLNQAAAGTGILIGPDVVLTNHHVVQAILTGGKPVTSLSCLFDFKVLRDGTVSHGPRIAVAQIVSHASPTQGELAGEPQRTLPTADELDYALLQLTEPIGNAPVVVKVPDAPARGWERLPADPAILRVGQGLMIAQHPAGEAMKLSIDTAAVLAVNANGSRVRYANNTEGGSSGSPVFDLQWNPVALHHLGDPAQGHPPAYNQGVIPLSGIRRRIVDQGLGGLLG